jgi:ribosomal protein L37AE/L43A
MQRAKKAKSQKRKTRTITTEDRCPKCNGLTLERDPEGDIHCWSCSSTFIGGKVEGKPHGDYLLERHQFYEDNKVALLADVSVIGGKETAKKWGISWGSLYHVLKRWGYEPKDVAEPPNQPVESEEKIDQKVAKTTQRKETKASRRGRNFIHLPANRKHDYIEEHKDEIIADLLSFGRSITCSKWDISETTIHVFEKKYLTNEQKDQITKIGMEIGKYIPDNGQMPPFPRFKDTWDVSVQLKWLEVYEALNRYSSENMKGGNKDGNPVAGSSK